MASRILIIEDDLSFASILEGFLRRNGYEVLKAQTVKSGKEALAEYRPGLLLLDYRLPDGTGLDIMNYINASQVSIPVVIMTSVNDIKTAIKTMKVGAVDYITKPVNPDELLMIIQDVFQGQTKTVTPSGSTFLAGKSEVSMQLEQHIGLVGPTDMSVIIQGESGTGKEFAARNIHAQSKRADGPFIAIDCGALSNELAAAELFGYVKGAFTGAAQNKKGQFEAANGGTLFLDEIGNLSYDIQVKLLRALQEKMIQPLGSTQLIKVDVRIIVATNDDLQKSIKANTFREDLYHRLNEFAIRTPSLRQRTEDLHLFCDYFIALANEELNRNVVALSPEVKTLFGQYEWPGNLRELKNVIRRAVLLTAGDIVGLQVLPDEMTQAVRSEILEQIGPDLKRVQELNEKELIEKTLKEVKYNKTKAATLLNIDRKTLYNKIQKYNLKDE